jgi:hypothetical protein
MIKRNNGNYHQLMQTKTGQTIKMLTRIFFLSFYIFVSLAQSFAQDHNKAGIKGGLSLTSLNGQTDAHKPGLQIGGVVVLGANEPIYFQTEFLLSQKGSKARNAANHFGLYYFEIPLMLGVEITQKLFFNAGFQPSFMLSGFHRSTNEQHTVLMKKDFNRFDYSTLISAEYLLKENFYLGFRYTHGFVPINENVNIFPAKIWPTNRILGIYATYMLR